jgi:threonine/homoserine/homoserine lactone efflux protein
MKIAELAFFLGTVFLISITGAMLPGPVTAVTIAKGHGSSRAGVFIALGHGLVEVPLILAIAFGLSVIFQYPWWKFAIGVVGGGFLVWMGIGLIRDRKALGAGEKTVPYGSFQAGALTSMSNPGFFIWWATVGAVLVTKSLMWGAIGVALFIIVHWSVDLIWYWLLTFMTHHGKKIMSPKVQGGVFAVCGILLVSFGAYFVLDGSGALERLGAFFS